MKKIFKNLSKANSISLFGPENIRPQTDYNPLIPGSDLPDKIDMRPKAVATREKQARKSLLIPLTIIGSVVLILLIPVFLHLFS